MATPNSMPRKANPLHLQILSALIETKPVSWVKRTLDPNSDPKKPVVNKTTVAGFEVVSALAQNVSSENIDRIAKRWIR